jgi:lysophospholipase L1-like esterase
LLIAIAGGELFARALLTSPSTQLFDPAIGYVNAPDSTLFQAREGFQRLRLNGLGLNSPPLGPPAPDRRRVLFVGDSITFAAQVPQDRNFVSLVGRAVPGIETVNGGRDALGPQDWAPLLARLDPAVKPDLTVLMISRGDGFDLRDAAVHIRRDSAGRPIGVSRARSARDALQEDLGPLIRHSALATFLVRRANTEWTTLKAGDSWTGWALRGGKPAGGGRNSGREVLDREAIEAQLVDILNIVKRDRRIVMVAIPAYRYQSGRKVELEPRSQAEAGLFDAAARRAGIPFIDVGPAMAAAYARTGRPLTGFVNSHIGEGHLNEEGHAVVAEAIAKGFEAMR